MSGPAGHGCYWISVTQKLAYVGVPEIVEPHLGNIQCPDMSAEVIADDM